VPLPSPRFLPQRSFFSGSLSRKKPIVRKVLPIATKARWRASSPGTLAKNKATKRATIRVYSFIRGYPNCARFDGHTNLNAVAFGNKFVESVTIADRNFIIGLDIVADTIAITDTKPWYCYRISASCYNQQPYRHNNWS
jgi:hypothetical protein